MAIMQMDKSITDPCPRCGTQLLTINGQLTKWITCPSCKYKKLEENQKKWPEIKSLR
jgi:uncharacterized Zn finger protein (UPF0148 family)